MTPVSDIYARISVLIEDSRYCKLSDEEIEYIFEKFIENAIVLFKELNVKYKPRVVENEFGEKFIQKTINNDNEEEEDLDLDEQVILAHGMIISWHDTVVLRDQFLKQRLNTKDFQQLSNATMLANNNALHERIYKDFIKMRRRYRNRNWNGDEFN